jgi:hypothetical protein
VRRALIGLGTVVGLAAVLTACQERLTSPAACPGLCPGGPQTLFESVLTPLPGLDSSFHTYVAPGQGSALLVSSGLTFSEDRAVYRFVTRQDSITVRDTARAYTVDSVMLTVNIVARDTLVGGLKVLLFRLPPTVDSTATFETVDPQLVDVNLIDTIAVPDSLHSGQINTMLRGSDVERVAIPAGTGGVLAVGLRMTAAAPTGIRVGSLAAGNGATFVSYLTVDVPDTGAVRNQFLSRPTEFNTFVTQNRTSPDPTLLTVGGDSSSRAIVRFELPPQLKDSATIVRATLELIPAHPLFVLPGDPAGLEAHAVLADLGAKSPITSDVSFISTDTLAESTSDTLRLEVTRLVKLWQASTDRPPAIFLLLKPEAATFTRAAFGSTNPASPVGPPRLLITYQLPFPFEIP